jgi:hypothetical protein
MVKMSHSFGKADPPKRVAYTVSDDWTSARRGNKKLRLCALGTALDRPRETIPSTSNQKVKAVISLGTGLGRPRETIPSTFDQQLEAAIGSGTNWVEVARRLPKPRTSQDLDVPKPLDRQEDIRPEWASPDPANSSGAISDYEMQILLLEQQNKKRLLMSRTSQDPNMPKPPDPQIPARPEWGAREPMSSDAALSDYQMQMMLLEQQNKKRLSIPRDSPTGQSYYNPFSRTSGKRDYTDYPPVPGEEYGNRGLTTRSNTIMKDSRGQILTPPMPPPVFTQVSQQAQKEMFRTRQAQARLGLLPPNSRLGSAATEDKEHDNWVFQPPEFESRRRQNPQERYFQKSYQIDHVARQATPRDAVFFHRRRTRSPPTQPYSLPLPSNAHTKQVLAGVDKYLEQRRTRPRTREISSQLRGHTRDEPLTMGFGPWE